MDIGWQSGRSLIYLLPVVRRSIIIVISAPISISLSAPILVPFFPISGTFTFAGLWSVWTGTRTSASVARFVFTFVALLGFFWSRSTLLVRSRPFAGILLSRWVSYFIIIFFVFSFLHRLGRFFFNASINWFSFYLLVLGLDAHLYKSLNLKIIWQHKRKNNAFRKNIKNETVIDRLDFLGQQTQMKMRIWYPWALLKQSQFLTLKLKIWYFLDVKLQPPVLSRCN